MKPKIVMLKFLQLEIYEKRKSGVRFVVNTEREKKTILLPQSSQIIPSSFIFWRQFIWLVNQCGNSGTTHKPWTLDLTSYQQTQSCTEWSTVPAGVFFSHFKALCCQSDSFKKKKKISGCYLSDLLAGSLVRLQLVQNPLGVLQHDVDLLPHLSLGICGLGICGRRTEEPIRNKSSASDQD